MSSLRPFKKLTDRFSPVRKARVAEKAAVLEGTLDEAKVAAHSAAAITSDGVGKTNDADK